MGCEAEASLPFVFFVVRPRMQILNACLRLCPCVCVSRVVFFFFSPSFLYVCIYCRVSGAARPCSESLYRSV